MLGMLPMSSVAAGRLMPAAMNMPSSSLLVSRAPIASDTVSGTPPALASLSPSFDSYTCNAEALRTCYIKEREACAYLADQLWLGEVIPLLDIYKSGLAFLLHNAT